MTGNPLSPTLEPMKDGPRFLIKIERVEREEDGRLYASGYGATTNPVPFSHKKWPRMRAMRFTKEFFEKAMPVYMSRKPKVRVMHTPALGTGGQTIEYRVDQGGVFIKVRVAQALEQAVEDGDYSEFSIGAGVDSVRFADASTTTADVIDGGINEFSLVDQGKDDGCEATISRAEGADERVEGDELTGGPNVNRIAIGAQLKRVAEEIVAAGATKDLTPIVERGIGSVTDILNAFQYLSMARAQELYEEATKGGEGGQAEKFLTAMLATAELAVAHLIEEFSEIFSSAGAMAENVAKDENVKLAQSMAAPILQAAEAIGDKALFSEALVKRVSDLSESVKVVRAKEKEKDTEGEEEGSFHDEMAAHHAAVSKIHCDYAKDEKDEKAKGYHEAMGAHHAAVATSYMNDKKRAAKAEQSAPGAPGVTVTPADPVAVLESPAFVAREKVLVDRVAGAEAQVTEARGALTAQAKVIEDLKIPALVERVAAAEKTGKELGEKLTKFLASRPGVRTFGAAPVERVQGGGADPDAKHKLECAQKQVELQRVVSSGDEGQRDWARNSLEVMRAGGMLDDRLKDCKTWEDAEKIRASAA